MKKKNGATILPFPSGLSSKDKKRARLSSQACGHIIEWAHENGLDVDKIVQSREMADMILTVHRFVGRGMGIDPIKLQKERSYRPEHIAHWNDDDCE